MYTPKPENTGHGVPPAPPAPPKQEMVIHLKFDSDGIEKIVSGVLKGVKAVIEEAENDRS